MKSSGLLQGTAGYPVGYLIVAFLSISALTVRTARADESTAGVVNPAGGAWSPTAVIMRSGTEVSITTKAGETIQGRFHHKTTDSLFVIASSDKVTRHFVRDSISQVSVYGTGSVERSLLLGAVGFAFGYAIGYKIDASGSADASMDRRISIGMAAAGLGILSGATTRARRARLSADAFWELPDTRPGNAGLNPGMRIELAIRF